MQPEERDADREQCRHLEHRDDESQIAFPAKYAAGWSGVPASLLSVPSSRSAAMLTPMATKVADIRPLAMIPAMKYCLKLTLVWPTSPWKIWPNNSSKMIGSENVKMTFSRCLANCLISITPRTTLTRPRAGGAACPGLRSSGLVAAIIALLRSGWHRSGLHR
jgi:hypothetical protein